MTKATATRRRSDAELERSLRDTVAAILQSGSLTDLTVKRVRAATEQTLHLPADFFKQEEWKERSKQIIETAASETPAASQSIPEDSSPVRKVKKQGGTAHRASEEAQEMEKVTREGKEDQKSRNESLPQISQESPKSPKSQKRQKVGTKVERDHQNLVTEPSREATAEQAQAAEAESDMSDLIDDEPQPKKRKRAKEERTPKESKPKQGAKPNAKSKSQQAQTDPDLEEIKRLQGWLIRCGIRKMWFKELAPYDGSKAKIRHLRDMLADVGLTGRYAIEKANQIRETRELQADLEAVQDGAKHWGATEPDEEEPASRRPKSRLAKGFASLDFLGDEGEETD